MKAIPLALLIFAAPASAVAAIAPIRTHSVIAERPTEKDAAAVVAQFHSNNELPLECRGYYVRAHKNGLSRCSQ